MTIEATDIKNVYKVEFYTYQSSSQEMRSKGWYILVFNNEEDIENIEDDLKEVSELNTLSDFIDYLESDRYLFRVHGMNNIGSPENILALHEEEFTIVEIPTISTLVKNLSDDIEGMEKLLFIKERYKEDRTYASRSSRKKYLAILESLIDIEKKSNNIKIVPWIKQFMKVIEFDINTRSSYNLDDTEIPF